MEEIYKKWKDKYYNKKIVDYSKYFTDDDIQLLHKLEVHINKNKIYTEYEHEGFEMDMIVFYEEAEYIDGTKVPPIRNIDEGGVSREDYKILLDIFYKIATDYEF